MIVWRIKILGPPWCVRVFVMSSPIHAGWLATLNAHLTPLVGHHGLAALYHSERFDR